MRASFSKNPTDCKKRTQLEFGALDLPGQIQRVQFAQLTDDLTDLNLGCQASVAE